MTAIMLALISHVQADTVQVCGFLPTIESVIAAQNGPIYDLGENALVSFICDAIPPAPIDATRGVGPGRTTVPISQVGKAVSVIVNGRTVTGIMVR
jgi:hypothetical protein